jgi:hypothetical protein
MARTGGPFLSIEVGRTPLSKPNVFRRLVEKARAFEKYATARQAAAELGLIGEETPPPNR